MPGRVYPVPDFILLILTFITCLVFFNVTMHAQSPIADTLKERKILSNEEDVGDLFREVLKRPPHVRTDSIKKTSLGPFYTPILYPGYALVTGYLIGLANNISFYTHKDKHAKLSAILIENIYTQYKQYINIARSNVWLNKNKINLLGDWRYYKFPTKTFGLGSATRTADADAVDYSHVRINEAAIMRIVGHLSGGAGVNIDYHYNIKESEPAHTDNDLNRYGLSKTSLSSGITLYIQYDNRVNSNNPLKGAYANVQLRNNLKTLGSSSNWQSATVDLRYYIPLSERSHNTLALWSYNCFTLSGKPPYFDLPSTSWDTYNNTAREYVEGRFRGLNFIYGEAECRFRITKNELFGGVVFTNVSSLSDWPSNRFEKPIPGAGLGLRIKINKFSGSNLCIDYGFGINGSKGLSFNINEVF